MRDNWKNKAETGKCPIFQGFEVKFPNLSLNCNFTILTQNTPLQFKNGAKKVKTNSEQIFNHSLKLDPSLSFVSELNPKR